ncbi:unnamed protein product [Chironomus riparius]|uniref:SUEL-type lectin domain-containing protein n=1 Tax=Chironomus riparius TaxID=315576 RepID=A0A9N9S3A7_9DIPT|nr:unnamed protein product [Chironomus riparius]
MKFILITLIALSVFTAISASFEKTINEGEHDHFECPSNQPIYVEYGKWTYNKLNWRNGFIPNWRNYFFLWGNLIGMCTYDVTEAVKKMCNGKSNCEIDGNRISLHSDECNYWMKLIVTYECLDCSEYENKKKGSDDHEHLRFKRQYGSKAATCTAHFLAFAAVGFQNNRNNHRFCPNQTFVDKHVCSHCQSNSDVVNFAIHVANLRNQHNYKPTNINSVFVGNPTYTQAGTLCKFYSALPKYNCHYGTITWTCYKETNDVRASHQLISGHYEPGYDI